MDSGCFQRFPASPHPICGGAQALEPSKIWLLTAFRPDGIIYVSGAMMNLRQIILSVLLTGAFAAAALAQAPQEQLIEPKTVPSANDSARAEAYYNFTMGHIYEQQDEST